MLKPVFMKHGYVYHGTWAHLNSVFHNNLPGVCVCMLLVSGSVKTLPWWCVHMQQHKKCWKCHFICSPCCIKGESGGLSVHPSVPARQWLGRYVPKAMLKLSGRGGLQGCGKLRIPHYLDNELKDGSKIVSPTYRPRSTPQ
jgi:hypothetical protein